MAFLKNLTRNPLAVSAVLSGGAFLLGFNAIVDLVIGGVAYAVTDAAGSRAPPGEAGRGEGSARP